MWVTSCERVPIGAELQVGTKPAIESSGALQVGTMPAIRSAKVVG